MNDIDMFASSTLIREDLAQTFDCPNSKPRPMYIFNYYVFIE